MSENCIIVHTTEYCQVNHYQTLHVILDFANAGFSMLLLVMAAILLSKQFKK